MRSPLSLEDGLCSGWKKIVSEPVAERVQKFVQFETETGIVRYVFWKSCKVVSEIAFSNGAEPSKHVAVAYMSAARLRPPSSCSFTTNVSLKANHGDQELHYSHWIIYHRDRDRDVVIGP